MKWKILSILLAAVFVLGACQADNDDPQNNNNGDDNVEQTRYEGDRDADNRFDRNNDVNEFNNGNRTRDTDNPGNNRNNTNNGENQYELADEAADRISEEVDGVNNAYVMKTDNNAYVAARLDNDNNVRNNNNVRNDNNIRNNNDTADNNNYTNNNNNNNATNINRDRGQEVTDDVKKEITRIVKSVDSDVDNVYVSTNPDFFDLAGNYADDVDSGKPIRGLFDQMGNMIERVFPQNKR